ncbi:MAG: DUF4190 domain-containing protein [bacterium]|nr:DUF4190 domain-containing protein [bacterium]
MGIASFVLGIISLVLLTISLFTCGAVNQYIQPAVFLLALSGLIFGIVAIKKKEQQPGFAKAGLIMSIVSMVLSIILFTACFLLMDSYKNNLNFNNFNDFKKLEEDLKKMEEADDEDEDEDEEETDTKELEKELEKALKELNKL